MSHANTSPHANTSHRGTLKRTLLAAVAILGLTAGAALAGDTEGRALHSTSRGVTARVSTRHDVRSNHTYRGGHSDRSSHSDRSRHSYRGDRYYRGPGYSFSAGSRHGGLQFGVRVRAHRHTQRCHYEAGHYEIRIKDVVIPGYWTERRVAARYEVRWDSYRGGYLRVLVRPARVIRKWVPRRIEQRRVKRYVAARWSCGH